MSSWDGSSRPDMMAMQASSIMQGMTASVESRVLSPGHGWLSEPADAAHVKNAPHSAWAMHASIVSSWVVAGSSCVIICNHNTSNVSERRSRRSITLRSRRIGS